MKRLNLGCYRFKKDGWINIDANAEYKPEIVADVTDLHMFEDDSVDEIYAGHLLEHIHKKDTNKVLKEWKRVLKPSGILHVVVPDIVKAIDMYEQGAADLSLAEIIGVTAEVYSDNPFQNHKQMFDQYKLLNVLAYAGFVGIRPTNTTDWDLPIVADVYWQTGLTCYKPTK